MSGFSFGGPPPKLVQRAETLRFAIHNFRRANGFVWSPTLKAYGYKWKIGVFSSSGKKWFRLHAVEDFRESMLVEATWRLHRSDGHLKRIGKTDEDGIVRGYDIWAHESGIATYLEPDGSLIIEVDIRIGENDKRVWYPEELKQDPLAVAFYKNASSENDETSDVTILVGANETVFRAHKSILFFRCKKLFEIATTKGGEDVLVLPKVQEDIFRALLEFVYTVQTPIIETKDVALAILKAADCFECVNLKLYAESVLVDRFLDANNAVELLLDAEAYSCALLKEAAMDIFLKEGTANSVELSKIDQSSRLGWELLYAVMSWKNPNNEKSQSTSEVDRMDVATLRNNLREHNLGLDGSKEVLVERLKSHLQQE